jgi:hypothetical protein
MANSFLSSCFPHSTFISDSEEEEDEVPSNPLKG